MIFRRPIITRLFSVLTALALLGGLVPLASAAQAEEVTLGIFSTSDMQGRYTAQNPLTGEKESVSYLKVSTAVAQQRKLVDASILIDAGDALDGSFQSWYSTTQRTGGSNPLATVLRYIGYDVFVPGEGEFRFSQAQREEFFDQLTSQSGTVGEPVSILAANYLSDKNQTPQEQSYEVFSVQAGGRTFRIGVLGLTATDIPDQVPAANCSGSLFAHEDNTAGSLAWEWKQYWQGYLRQTLECDLVVVVCHDGLDSPGQVRSFISSTTGIDLVITGHDGAAYATTADNADGQAVPVVSGGGESLTSTTVTLRSDGTFQVGQSSLLSLADYDNDAELARLTNPSYTSALAYARQPVGIITGDWDSKTGFFYQQTDTTDLIGRAMRWASGADLALVSVGRMGEEPISALMRQSSSAQVNWQDCYNLYPHADSTLCTVELTGAQLRAWLVRSAQGYTLTATGSVSGGDGGVDIIYGLDYDLYLGDGQSDIQVSTPTYQGTAVTDDQVFTVAVDSARLTGPWGDPYGWYETTGIDLYSDKVTWRAWADYSFSPQSGTIPAILAGYVSYTTAQTGSLTPSRESGWTVYPGNLDGAVTRLELVTLLYGLAGSPTPAANAAFLDVSDNSAVIWAAEAGVVSGNGTGLFLPAQQVTREQAAVMLYGFVKSQGLSLPLSGQSTELLDEAQISSWAREAVGFCIQTGLLPAIGRGDLFQPNEPLTRYQAWQVFTFLSNLE